MISLCRTSVSNAMPNSPAIEITTPVRIDLNHDPVNQRDTIAREPAVFSTISPISIAETSENSSHSSRMSSSMPTVMKNRPSRMSRNGRITVSI